MALAYERLAMDEHRAQRADAIADITPTRTSVEPGVGQGDPAPREIGPYHFVRMIGRGGMGEVWLAEQSKPVQRWVALKLIKGGMATSDFVARFDSERQALARMNHPAIARVFDGGSTPDGHPYFAMEYVDGVPVTTYCDRKRLTLRGRLDLFIAICEGVQHAHQKAILHRDLKPSNILVTEIDGKPAPKIIDFGLAKALTASLAGDTSITRMGTILGTPDYMSPEQAGSAGQDVDTRTDVYSLGVILFELLVGTLPARLSNLPLPEMLRKLNQDDTPRPSTKVLTLGAQAGTSAENRSTDPSALARQLRGDLDLIVLKATEKDRARRYGTPSDLAGDIGRYLRYEPVWAHAPGMAYRARKYARRHLVGVSAGAVLAAMLVVFAIAQNIQLRRVTRERDRADRITSFMTEMFNVADPRQARGRNVTAREVLDKASSDIDRSLGKDPELQAQMMETMGHVYNQIGAYSRAEGLFRDSAAIRRRVLGGESPPTLNAMSLWGGALYNEGHYPEAEKLLSQVLLLQRKVDGPEHPDTLNSMSRLGATLTAERKYAEAEKLVRAVLAVQRKVFGPEDIRIAGTETSLTGILRLTGRNREAEELQRNILNIYRRVLGADHPSTLKSMHNLANNLIEAKRYGEAEKLQREALPLFNRVLGPENPITLDLMHALAVSLMEQRRYDEAQTLERQVVQIEQRVRGPRHPHLGGPLLNLASIAALTGKPDEAFRLLRQAVDAAPADMAAILPREEELASLRKDPRFADLVALAKERAGSVSSTGTR